MRYLILILAVLVLASCRSRDAVMPVPQPGAAWSTSPVNVNIYPPRSSAVDLPPDCPSFTMPGPAVQPAQPCSVTFPGSGEVPLGVIASGSPDASPVVTACLDGA